MLAPKPQMQAAAKLTLLIGGLASVMGMGASLYCFTFAPGTTIDNYSLFLMALPGAVIPAGITFFLLTRIRRRLVLPCNECHKACEVFVD